MKIPTMPMFALGKQYPFTDLPNEAGFTCQVRRVSGHDFPAIVKKDALGLHYLADRLGNRLQLGGYAGWSLA
jgi:hypothetical protein